MGKSLLVGCETASVDNVVDGMVLWKLDYGKKFGCCDVADDAEWGVCDAGGDYGRLGEWLNKVEYAAFAENCVAYKGVHKLLSA